MKTRLLPLLFLSILFLNFTTPRKEKRQLIDKVDRYVEKTISDTSYTVDKAQLLLLLDYHFLSLGYTCTGLSPSQVRYSKEKQYTTWGETIELQKCKTESTVTTIDRREETRWITTYKKRPIETRQSNIEQVSVVIELFELGDTYRILTNKIRGQHVYNPFNESKLRRFLYSQCFGNNLSLPASLRQEIESYNSSQAKERKKIVFN
jgi:hypothetical protein